jgi:formate hydrogenlyase transcriptional activator
MVTGADLVQGSGPESAGADGEMLSAADDGSVAASELNQRFERLLLQVSTTFVSTPANQVDACIESALRRVVEFLGLDRGMLARIDAETRQRSITHSWAAPGVEPHEALRLAQVFPWGSKRILAGEMVTVSRIDELPEAAAIDRETARIPRFPSSRARRWWAA